MNQTCLVALAMIILSYTTASAGSEADAIRITMNEFHKRTRTLKKETVTIPIHSDENKTIETSFSSKIYSKYVDNAAFVAHNKPVVQSELSISHIGSGLYVDIWHSASLAHGGISDNYGNEMDYTLGWSGDLAGMAIDTGITYIDNIDLFTMPDGDVVQPYLELSKQFEVDDQNMLTPFIKTEWGFPAKGNSKELKGLYIYAGLKHNLTIANNLNLNQKIILTFDDGAFGADRALVGGYEINPSFQFLKQPLYTMLFELSARAIGPLAASKDDTRELQFIGGAGFLVNY